MHKVTHRLSSLTRLTHIHGVGHIDSVGSDPKDELVVPCQLHVHGGHGHCPFLDPPCQPGYQPHPPALVEGEVATQHTPTTGLLCPSYQLRLCGAWERGRDREEDGITGIQQWKINTETRKHPHIHTNTVDRTFGGHG